MTESCPETLLSTVATVLVAEVLEGEVEEGGRTGLKEYTGVRDAAVRSNQIPRPPLEVLLGVLAPETDGALSMACGVGSDEISDSPTTLTISACRAM